MWKFVSVFTSLWFMSLVIYAGKGDLEIQLVNNNKIELNPGSNSNMAIMLVNNTDSDKEFQLKITTPDGLSQLTDYSSVIVERASKKLKIFSFYVNESTGVGDYSIGIEAWDKLENSKIGEIQIPVYVKPQYAILTSVMKAPDYVFSGDTLSVQFMVQNLSNTKVNIEATIINARISETKKLALDPGSSVFIGVFVTTEKDIIQYTRKGVSLSATIVESPETTSETSCVFDVIPSGKIKFDSYNRIPTKISGLFVTNNQTGERLYGYMFDITGSGTISYRKKREIAFHFRGPNRQGNPILGQTDEYNIKYASPHSKAAIGDNSYTLTDLTEGSRSGRGLEYEHTLKKISLGTFINFPRFYPNLQRVAAVYGGYTLEKKLNIKLGYLNKLFVTDSAAQLFSFSGGASPLKWGDIKFEYAMGMSNGKTTKAYSTDLRVHFSRYRMFFAYTKADQDFPGYLSNSQYVSSGVNASVFRKVDLTLNYNLNHTNIALDTMYANAPFSSNLSFSAGYAINFNHSLNIGASMRSNEDMSLKKKFNYKEYTARIGLRSRINRFGINAYGAMGKTENLLPLNVGELTNVINANLSMQYNVNKSIFVKTFVSYMGGQQYLTGGLTNVFYGATIDANWGSKVKVLFQYQNGYQVEEYYRDRSLLGLQASYLMHRNHEVAMGVDYDLRKNSLNNTVLSASLKYTYTINIPVARKEDVGGLQGRIINHGVDNIEGILLTLAGNIVFSDKKGEFDIPFVKTGTHFLFMDNSKSGLNTIAETPGPYKIDILPGEKTYFEVSLTKSGKITGTIVIEEDENKDKKGFIAVKAKLDKLIIEVNNGIETYRVFTNQDGTFGFNDLRPGTWKLIVYDRGIPAGYQLLTNEYNINLSSAEIKNVEIAIRKISRKIKFQKS